MKRSAAITLVLALAFCRVALGEGREETDVSTARLGALPAGRYDNSAQVARGRAAAETPAPQHVTVTIEPTQQLGWQLWRVHMDVDPEVAKAAGSDTSLDAVWAMNVSHGDVKNSFWLIPYTVSSSVDVDALNASNFDRTQWLSLEACTLTGEFEKSHVLAQASPDEMCVAETMGLGGKRAFLPTWIERTGDWLHVQLIYFGRPWRVDAHRVIS
jgi:hypothetical protein